MDTSYGTLNTNNYCHFGVLLIRGCSVRGPLRRGESERWASFGGRSMMIFLRVKGVKRVRGTGEGGRGGGAEFWGLKKTAF